MKALIVHNSDKVKACFIGKDNAELLDKIMASEYSDDILDRLGEKTEGIGIVVSIDTITDLYHDGDSEDGYTLIDVL